MIPETVKDAREAASLSRAALLQLDPQPELGEVLRDVAHATTRRRTRIRDRGVLAEKRLVLVRELQALGFEAWTHLSDPDGRTAFLSLIWPDDPDRVGQ